MVDMIEPALARRLDMFSVPKLSPDFSARVLAKAMELPQSEAAAAPPLPRQRRALPRRLWRAGGMGLGTIAIGMVSISAAAMGYFGEPIRKAVAEAPMIGSVVERVIPQPERKREAPQLAAKKAEPAPKPAEAAPSLASEAMPTDADLPERRGWRARAAAMTPEQREAWLAAHPVAAERIARRKAWRESNPEAAARLDEQRALKRAAMAERREMRRAARQEWQRRQLAREAEGGAASAEGSLPAWRLERRERLRQWREQRMKLREQREAGAIQPEASEQP